MRILQPQSRMNKQKLSILGTVVLISSAANAFIARSEAPFDRAGLVNLIQSHSNITTIDTLVPMLPGPYRLNFTLKHGFKRNGERGHLVEDKVSQSADPLAPRAILWDERTGFAMSYNGGTEGQTNGNRLDLLSFDKQTKTFSLEQIDFPIQPLQVKLTTSDCASCHGPDMRPIFSMYPDWPSFYGSDNDELTANKVVQNKERADYSAFMAQVHQSNRYAPLFDNANIQKYLGINLYPTWPYRQDVSERAQDISRAFTFRASLRLGIILNRMNAQMISKKIMDHPNYARFNRFYAFNTLACPVKPSAAAKMQSYRQAVQQILGQPARVRPNGLLDYNQMLAIFGLRVNDVDIRYSYNHPGYANTDASQKIMEIGYIGNYYNSYFDGSATFDELISAIIVKDLTRSNPNLNNARIYRGLTEKYTKFAARFAFDKEFFAEADTWGKWIAMPYAPIVFEAHHRERFSPEMQTFHTAVCDQLERTM